VRVEGGVATIEGTNVPAGTGVPERLVEKALLACRPSDIDFVPEDGQTGGTGGGGPAGLPGIPGKVLRRTYLGDIVDFKLQVGNAELRVQKTRRASVLREGEACRIRFNRILWYPEDGD
jgi:iron(III) transport system ATP-binding protein